MINLIPELSTMEQNFAYFALSVRAYNGFQPAIFAVLEFMHH